MAVVLSFLDRRVRSRVVVPRYLLVEHLMEDQATDVEVESLLSAARSHIGRDDPLMAERTLAYASRRLARRAEEAHTLAGLFDGVEELA